jgi:serine/threonine-protein kinase
MGVVYLARRGPERVALKTIRPAGAATPTSMQRFLRETSILRQCVHPRIVSFRDVGECQGLLYFAMEFVEGTDAGRLVTERGPVNPAAAVTVACHVLEALSHAHALGFVHRDIKPANVLLQAEPSSPVGSVKLADFGLARAYQASELSGLTMAGSVGGTPAFMPPEQVTDFRSVQPAADQYAAAATLYYLLSGHHVYDPCPSGHELLKRILTTEPIPLQSRRPDLPPGLTAAVQQALSRNPAGRHADADTFRRSLLPWAGSQGMQAA